MSDHDLNDNLVKLVRYSIVSIERGHERVLVCNECEYFADNMARCDFHAWVVADYCRRHYVAPSTKKFLRVSYCVLGRWPKASLNYEQTQLLRLEEIALAIQPADDQSPAVDSSGGGHNDGADDAEPDAPSSEPESLQDNEEDDLTRVKGIGPGISKLLKDAGISTFRHLAATDPDQLQEILDAAGRRYRIADPTTWPEQARRLIEEES